MLEGTSRSVGKNQRNSPQDEAAEYHLRRMSEQGATLETHRIVACDDEEAIELAYVMCGPNRAQLWLGSRLVYEIEAFILKHAPGSG